MRIIITSDVDLHKPRLSILGGSPGPQPFRIFLSLAMAEFTFKSFTLFMWWRVFESCSQICYLTGWRPSGTFDCCSEVILVTSAMRYLCTLSAKVPVYIYDITNINVWDVGQFTLMILGYKWVSILDLILHCNAKFYTKTHSCSDKALAL